MASSCMSKLAKFCRRCRARSDLYTGGAGKVWTVYELACFLSPLVVDVVLPVLMQRQALAVLVSCSGGATDPATSWGSSLGLVVAGKGRFPPLSRCLGGCGRIPHISYAQSRRERWCSRVSFRWLPEEFQLLSSCCLRLSRPHMEIWTLVLGPTLAGLFRAMLGSTVDLYSWSFRVGFGRISGVSS